ncbi:MAG: hypothetical protein ACE5I5_10315 [Candidatus Heimdallarchaeota archaeon]
MIILSLEAALAEANREIKELKEKVTALEANLLKTQGTQTEKESEIERLLTNHTNEREELKSKIFGLENEVRRTQDELTGKLSELNTYEEANQSLKQEIENLKGDLASNVTHANELEQKIEKTVELEEKLQISEINLKKTNEELEEARIAKYTLEDTLKKKDEKIATLEKEHNELKDQMNQQLQDLNSLREKIDIERKKGFDYEQALTTMKKFMENDNRVKVLATLETTRKMSLKSLAATTGLVPVELKRIIEQLETDQYVQTDIHDDIELLRVPWQRINQ